jgi:competence protein ComEC
LAAAWLTGVGGVPWLHFPAWQWLTLGAAALLAAYGVRRDRASARLFLGLSFLFLGAMRTQIALETRSMAKVTGHIGQSRVVELGGVVSSRPETTGPGVRFDLRAQWIAHDGARTGETVDGMVQIVAEPGTSAQLGEVIVARGRLRPSAGPERIGHSGVLEAVSTLRLAPARASPMALLDRTRQRMVDRLEDVLPSAEASLIAGVLLVADERMPEEVRASFRATGTAHILAVSGFNVTIVAAASLAAFASLLGARRAGLAAGATVLLYTLLAVPSLPWSGQRSWPVWFCWRAASGASHRPSPRSPRRRS